MIKGLLSIFLLCIPFHIFAGHDDGVSTYYYSSIPGCSCFAHCCCLFHDESGLSKYKHPYKLVVAEDMVWHDFMEKIISAIIAIKEREASYLYYSRHYIPKIVTRSGACKCVCMLCDYLSTTEQIRIEFEKSRINALLACDQRFKNDPDRLAIEIENMHDRFDRAASILSTIPLSIVPLYKKLLESCPHAKSQYNLAWMYNKGFINLMEGNEEGALEDISSFIDQAKATGQEQLLTSEIFKKKGESFLEVGLYHDAITALNEAIRRDPENREAYFQRASAYFEIGDFDQSLQDYIKSEKSNNISALKKAPRAFVDAFTNSVLIGSKDALSNFVPSLCYSAYGLSESLWVFADQPIDSLRHLANAVYEMAEQVTIYLKDIDKDTLHEYVEEVISLYEQFDYLSDQKKGELIGYTLGKYGADIFAGSILLKGISTYKKIKEANRLCNMEAMAKSASGNQFISEAALKHAAKREAFFSNVKIHWDSQNKHVPGKHNYLEGKSIFEHSDAQRLLRDYAGKGNASRNTIGNPGYREIVDFEEFIGYHCDKEFKVKTPTTWGEIHYSKKGAHIVPIKPLK